jgi:hypothetical protein
MTRRRYQEPGERGRDGYELTPAGRELVVVLGALQQWGDEHLPHPLSPTMVRRSRSTGRPLHVAFVDDAGHEVGNDDVDMARTATYPTGAAL